MRYFTGEKIVLYEFGDCALTVDFSELVVPSPRILYRHHSSGNPLCDNYLPYTKNPDAAVLLNLCWAMPVRLWSLNGKTLAPERIIAEVEHSIPIGNT